MAGKSGNGGKTFFCEAAAGVEWPRSFGEAATAMKLNQ
jgi:hypothetical protein